MIRERIISNYNKKRVFELNEIADNFRNIYTIILYGSRVSDFSNNLSDIDLFYLSEKKLTMMDEAEVLYNINKHLQTTEVDFVNLRKLSLKDQYDILTNGTLIYNSDEIKLSDYKEKIICLYFDFMHIHNEYFECFKKNLITGDIIKL